MNLTDSYINSIQPTAKVAAYSDKGRTGLRLIVRPSGVKSWTQRLSVDGKRIDKGLGSYPAVSLKQARKLAAANQREAKAAEPTLGSRGAAEIVAAIERTNAAVLSELKALRQDHAALVAEVAALRSGGPAVSTPAAHGPSFREVSDECLEIDAKAWKAGTCTESQTRALLTKYAYPALADMPIGAIGSEHVIEVLKPHWLTMAKTADKVLQRLNRTFAYAIAKRMRADNPADSKTIRAALPKRGTGSRTQHHQSIPHGELAAALAKMEASTASDAVKALVPFLALTAVRTGEARMADWAEFDLGAKLWTIPANRMKAGRSHEVPLSDSAVAILKGLGPKRQGLVFSRKGKALSDRTLSMAFTRNELGGTVHGLRSSFRDWAGDTGVDRTVAEHCLAHRVGNSTEQSYARSTMLDRRRQVMNSWGEYLRALPQNPSQNDHHKAQQHQAEPADAPPC